MILVLLDTNAYLRLAKRIRPLLGVRFGHKEYALTILKDVEDEVHRSPTLQFKFPWFDEGILSAERIAKTIRLTSDEKQKLALAQDVLRNWVVADIGKYTNGGRSPPSPTDCRVLAFTQIRPAIVVTDDLGMHTLAEDFQIPVWHGPDLLSKMRTAKIVTDDLIREIYAAMEANGDLTKTWLEAKQSTFLKVFRTPR